MNGILQNRRENLNADLYSIDSSQFLFPVHTDIIAKAEATNNSIVKKVTDIVITLILFIAVFSWLFPLIILIIKITSKGPVFFKQERTGLNGQAILCYKFRTMTEGCKSVDTNGKFLQAVKNDPRITKVGRILRRTSLDELPQFWNVLKGEMSIVGPRPHPKELNEESILIIENYHLRNSVKPGITGLAQIKGYRGATHETGLMQERINYDIWYIKNWNIILDIKIIALTGYTVITGDENAY